VGNVAREEVGCSQDRWGEWVVRRGAWCIQVRDSVCVYRLCTSIEGCVYVK